MKPFPLWAALGVCVLAACATAPKPAPVPVASPTPPPPVAPEPTLLPDLSGLWQGRANGTYFHIELKREGRGEFQGDLVTLEPQASGYEGQVAIDSDGNATARLNGYDLTGGWLPGGQRLEGEGWAMARLSIPDHLTGVVEEDLVLRNEIPAIVTTAAGGSDGPVIVITPDAPIDWMEGAAPDLGYRYLARGLAAKGAVALRLDWNPDYEKTSWRATLQAAVRWADRTYPRRSIVILGYRLGATIVPGFAAEELDVDGLILLADAPASSAVADLGRMTQPVLVAYGTRDGDIDPEVLHEFEVGLGRGPNITIRELEGLDHRWSSGPAEEPLGVIPAEAVFQLIDDWIRKEKL